MGIDESRLALAHYDGSAAQGLLDVLCDIYADAYGVDPGIKVEAFRGRAQRAFSAAGFGLVTAQVEAALVGFVFGYTLQPGGSWWAGLQPQPAPGFTEETGSRTAVVAEVEVRAAWQRQGVGRVLHDEFLAERPEERATLATGMEVPARQVYSRWGWTEIGVVPGSEQDYFSGYRLFVLPLKTGAS